MTQDHAPAWPTGGSGDMFRLISALPDQLEASATLKGLEAIAPPKAPFSRVLLCGMGGSAIAGDLVQPLLEHQPVSLEVWRDYDLPHWADEQTLILVASYSGNTEESLSALVEARRRGCPILGISSGGRLQKAAEGEGGPPFALVTLPGGLPPRASLGYGLGALVRVLDRLGLVSDADQEIDEAVTVLRRLNPLRLWPVGTKFLHQADAVGPADPAGMVGPAELAAQLVDAVPVLYTAGLEARGAGVRLKGQINENSKAPVCLGVFPELNHNDLVGWELSAADRGRFVLLILSGKLDNARIEARVRITRELLMGEFPVIHGILASGERPLARVLSLVQYGDYLSCHLARMKNVDPVPVDRIGQLKDQLEKL